MKTCSNSNCTVVNPQPLHNFHIRKPSKDGRNARCNTCRIDTQRTRYKKHVENDPNYFRRRNLWNLYKITLEDFDVLLEKQGGCAICEDTNAVRWVVDHDHACCTGQYTCGKCIRGILCDPCNNLLGRARDSSEILMKAITYLHDKEAYRNS